MRDRVQSVHDAQPQHARGDGRPMKSVVTRFRAFQLGNPGSSFSYYADGHFTVLEGRLTDVSRASLIQEMRFCGVETASSLHITSWDRDHCCATELRGLLDLINPARIECPGYAPHTENGKECLRIIRDFEKRRLLSNRSVRVELVTPAYIGGLDSATELAFNPIFYHPKWIDPEHSNNNSTIKFFRSGIFNVLSLGDVEDPQISAWLRRCKLLQRETDIVILAHHGADNGFTNKRLLAHLRPALAVCSADYDNTYEHPRQEIRDLLYEHGIRLMTTKTGDVIAKSIGDHSGAYRAINLKANSSEISSACDFRSKKARLLSFNADTLRQIYVPRPTYPR
jgi:competence protein ComEC